MWVCSQGNCFVLHPRRHLSANVTVHGLLMVLQHQDGGLGRTRSTLGHQAGVVMSGGPINGAPWPRPGCANPVPSAPLTWEDEVSRCRSELVCFTLLGKATAGGDRVLLGTRTSQF